MSDIFFHPTVRKIGDNTFVVVRKREGWAQEFLDPESLCWQAARPEKDFVSENYAYERMNKLASRVGTYGAFNLRITENGTYTGNLYDVSYEGLFDRMPESAQPDANRQYILDLGVGGTTVYKIADSEYLIERLS